MKDPAALIVAAKTPEDLFGKDPRSTYLRLVQAVHPDKGGDPLVFRRLQEIWEKARRLLALGLYGTGVNPVTVRTRRGEYLVERLLAAGQIADVRLATLGDDAVAFKLARRPGDNDLLRVEARRLRGLGEALEARYAPFLPELIESFTVRQSGGRIKQVNALGYLDGFYTLRQVFERYPAGLHPLDTAWMWRRLLFILGAVHEQGTVHGAINPDHVLIHPEKHGLVLLDWCYSVERGGRVVAIDGAWRSWVPPEILERKPVGPETDLYMAASVFHAITRPTRGFGGHFRSMMLKPQRRRMNDAWEMKDIFEEYLERNVGPRRFRPFSMNGRET